MTVDTTEGASEESAKLFETRNRYSMLQAPGTNDKSLKAQWHVKVPKTILVEVPDSSHLSFPARLSRHLLLKAVHIDQSLLSRQKNRRASPLEILPKRRMRLPLDHDPRFRFLHVGHRPAQGTVHQAAVAETIHAVGNCMTRDAENREMLRVKFRIPSSFIASPEGTMLPLQHRKSATTDTCETVP